MHNPPSGTFDRCCHCGMCVAVCPEGVLSLDARQYPVPAAKEKCTNCGLCAAVCPGRSIDYANLETLFLDGPHSHPGGGRFHGLSLGRDTDDERVLRSSAGGVVSAVVRHCLKTGLADLAVGVRWGAPGTTEPCLVTGNGDIDSCRQSKYQIAPVCTQLRRIPEDKKILFVGTGCQVAAVRKLQARDPSWAKRIPLVVGIFCQTGNLAPEAMPFIYRVMNVRRESVRDVQFREGPYPGRLKVATDGPGPKPLDKDDYKWLYVLFTERRCMECPDLTNALSDIAVGDPFDLATHPAGQSAVVVRSTRGADVLAAMVRDGELALDPLDMEDLARAQGLGFDMAEDNMRPKSPLGIRFRFSKERLRELDKSDGPGLKLRIFRAIFSLRKPLRLLFTLLPGRVFTGLSRLTTRE